MRFRAFPRALEVAGSTNASRGRSAVIIVLPSALIPALAGATSALAAALPSSLTTAISLLPGARALPC
jgi:hypothetical protein